MIIAVLGSIDGDSASLERVLEALDQEGIQTILCVGNCAAGSAPNRVVEILRQRRIPTVQGESDRQLARFGRSRKRLERELHPDRLQRLESAHAACSSANIEWLAGLPRQLREVVDGEPVVVFNGTLGSPGIYLNRTDDDERFRRQREISPARIYVCGGPGDRFVRYVDEALFINPGALCPGDSGEIGFVCISTESGRPEAALRTVARSSTA